MVDAKRNVLSPNRAVEPKGGANNRKFGTDSIHRAGEKFLDVRAEVSEPRAEQESTV